MVVEAGGGVVCPRGMPESGCVGEGEGGMVHLVRVMGVVVEVTCEGMERLLGY